MAFAIAVIVFKRDGAVDWLVGLQPLQKFFVFKTYFILGFFDLAFVEAADAVLL